MKKLKELHLIDSNGKEHVLPIKTIDGIDNVVELPKDWTQEMIDAYTEYMYPKGHLTMYYNEKKQT